MPDRLPLAGRLVLIPGAGPADVFYAPQVDAFGDAVLPGVEAAPPPNHSAKMLGRRYGEALRDRFAAEGRPQTLVVAGASLGAVAAVEAARVLEPDAVVLVGVSGTASLEAQLAERAARLTPAPLAAKGLKPMVAGFGLREGLDDRSIGVCQQVSAAVGFEGVRSALAALSDWAAAAEWAGLSCPVHTIHGRDDWLLKLTGRPDEVIPSARHLIHLTHPQTVNRFIKDAVEAAANTAAHAA